MIARGKVNVVLQMILALIPIADLFAAYRIKKLRLFILLALIPSITVAAVGPIIIDLDYYSYVDWDGCISQHSLEYCNEALPSGEDCKPDPLLSSWLVDFCERDSIQAFNIIQAVFFFALGVYIMRHFSILWNKQFQ